MIRATTAKLLRLWWRRWRNRGGRLVALPGMERRGAPPKPTRTGTRPRGAARSPWLYFAIALLTLPFLHWQTVTDLRHRVDARILEWTTTQESAQALPADAPMVPADVAKRRAIALLALLLFVGVLFTELSQETLSAGGWDVEWLATLPIGMGELFTARLVARTLMSPLSFFWLVPLLALLSWESAPWWAVPLLVLAAALPLLLLRAAISVFFEATLHLRVSQARLRNLKGVCAIVGTATLFFGLCARQTLADAALGMGPWGALLDWLPTGIVVRTLADAGSPGRGGIALAEGVCALLQALAAALLVVAWLRRSTRDGVVAGGRRESARSAAPARIGGSPFSPFVRRELKLLSRDFNYLSQALLVPLIFVGFQLLNMRSALVTQFDSLPAICAFAFGITAYTYQFSCLRALALEQDSLWMLATFPRPLDAALRAKSRTWSALIAIYPAAIVALGLGHVDFAEFKAGQLASLGMLAVGVPMFAFLFTSLGVISGDTLVSHEQRQRLGMTQLLSLFLIALYTSVIGLGDPWRCFGATALTAALTVALWQKAADTLPHLLDPWSPVARKLSLADGLGAALVFFVLQGLIELLLRVGTTVDTAARLFLAYAIAGVVACALSIGGLWRFEAGRVPRFFGSGASRAVALGVGAGTAVGAVAVAAQWLLRQAGFLTRGELGLLRGDDFGWLLLLAVVAAPLCEEYIFRGLIFGGLERLWGFRRAALGSALIFAVVHPMLSAPTVFLLGLSTAFVYARSGMLLGPIVTHVVYNAAILAGTHWLSTHSA
ncbi:MAG TPA: type II CAAX endopeptidase family protein [Planctomycetota bacterium]|nr:type II CAAX endopeptidase family protein [Planctomycetota bacterium]